MTDIVPLILMYVYFDDLGDIKAISPNVIPAYSGAYSSATFPLSQVEMFLDGRANTFNYFVKSEVKRFTSEYFITLKKNIEISKLRTLDSYLIDITKNKNTENTMIFVYNNIPARSINIILNPELIGLLDNGTDSEKQFIQSFIDMDKISFFFTRKNDPYYLIFTVTLVAADLYRKGEICIDHDINLEGLSIFTQNINNGYRYTER